MKNNVKKINKNVVEEFPLEAASIVSISEKELKQADLLTILDRLFPEKNLTHLAGHLCDKGMIQQLMENDDASELYEKVREFFELLVENKDSTKVEIACNIIEHDMNTSFMNSELSHIISTEAKISVCIRYAWLYILHNIDHLVELISQLASDEVTIESNG